MFSIFFLYLGDLNAAKFRHKLAKTLIWKATSGNVMILSGTDNLELGVTPQILRSPTG